MKIDKRIIRNILDSINDKLISKRQLEKVLRDVLQDKYTENIIVNLRRNKDTIYVFKGYYYILSIEEKKGDYTNYSTNEMLYAILNKLNIRWYLGLYSALERNNILWQGIVNPIIINSEISGERKILGIRYRFCKIKRDKIDFGYIKKTTKNRITFYYSNPEKTYLDFIYLKKIPPIKLSKFTKKQKLKLYLKNYSKNFKKKVFYL